MEKQRAEFHSSLLAAGYAVGLLGWELHWAYDLGDFGFSSSGVPVHLVSEMTMQLGGILALMTLTSPLRQAFGQAMTYAWLAIGVLIAFVQP